MKTGTICTRRVSIADPQTTLMDAAIRMREEHIGDLIVVERRDGRTVPVGVLTDRDIVVAAVAQAGDHLNQLLVGDLVTRPVVTAHINEDSMFVARRMRENAVRRLPVVDDDGALVGVVTVDDLIGALHAELDEIAHLVTHQARVEAQVRP